VIQFAPGLPKTRSGKIMRSHPAQDRRGPDLANLGDTSTLVRARLVVDDRVKNRAAAGARATTEVSSVPAPLVRRGQASTPSITRWPRSPWSARRIRCKGEALWAFVTPDPQIMASDVLGADIKGFLRREMGRTPCPQAVIFGRCRRRRRRGRAPVCAASPRRASRATSASATRGREELLAARADALA
jgi:hypothetical protein